MNIYNQLHFEINIIQNGQYSQLAKYKETAIEVNFADIELKPDVVQGAGHSKLVLHELPDRLMPHIKDI